jgi:hypothetical protein
MSSFSPPRLRPEKTTQPPAQIEAAYPKADAAIQKLVDSSRRSALIRYHASPRTSTPHRGLTAEC